MASTKKCQENKKKLSNGLHWFLWIQWSRKRDPRCILNKRLIDGMKKTNSNPKTREDSLLVHSPSPARRLHLCSRDRQTVLILCVVDWVRLGTWFPKTPFPVWLSWLKETCWTLQWQKQSNYLVTLKVFPERVMDRCGGVLLCLLLCESC